ncbi:MAG: hypothetical protein ACR2QW_02135 [bacterium]
MKHTRLTITIAMTGLLVSGFSLADVTTNEDANPDDWNRSVKLQPMNKSNTGQVTAFSKENQLRCWQAGDLIVLENGWKPVDSGKGSLMSNGSKRLHAYDYGETFCIYLGG